MSGAVALQIGAGMSVEPAASPDKSPNRLRLIWDRLPRPRLVIDTPSFLEVSQVSRGKINSPAPCIVRAGGESRLLDYVENEAASVLQIPLNAASQRSSVVIETGAPIGAQWKRMQP